MFTIDPHSIMVSTIHRSGLSWLITLWFRHCMCHTCSTTQFILLSDSTSVALSISLIGLLLPYSYNLLRIFTWYTSPQLKSYPLFAKNLRRMPNIYIYIHVTGEMDISGGSVPAGSNLTGGIEPGMNINI